MRHRFSLLAAAAVVATTTAVAVPAHAAGQNGLCERYELCLYWDSNVQGSVSDFSGSVNDFAGYRFLGPGAGQGTPVKNNSASANNTHGRDARVFYNEYQSGPYDTVPAFSIRNLVNTWNNNASFCWC